MSKLSIYNVRVPLSGKSDILYNCVSDKFVAIRHDIATDTIGNIKPATASILRENGMIVTDDTDERKNVIEIWTQNATSYGNVTVIINPTLRCNFNCWYCYENHNHAQAMDDTILKGTENLIKKISEGTNQMSLSFFGGEPFLEFERIVKPIIKYAESLMSTEEKSLNLSFTTNGFLLTQQVIEYLSGHNVKFMQITLDGGKETHNQTRVSKGKDSFDTITKNIKSLLTHGIAVTLRINVTPRNIGNCSDIVHWISTLSTEDKRRLTVNVQQVWQTANEADIDSEIDSLIDSICAAGVYAYPAILDNLRNMCYADKANTVVVNSDGRIFQCTAVNFESAESDSELGSRDFERDIHNKFQERQRKRFLNQMCVSCFIFPLCLGGCARCVTSAAQDDYCIYQGHPEKKDQLVLTIIKDRIRRNSFYQFSQE